MKFKKQTEYVVKKLALFIVITVSLLLFALMLEVLPKSESAIKAARLQVTPT